MLVSLGLFDPRMIKTLVYIAINKNNGKNEIINDSKHLVSIFYVPGIVQNTLNELFHVTITIILWNKYFYPHVTDKVTEVYRN